MALHDPDLPDALRDMPGAAAPAYEGRQQQREGRLAQLGAVLAAKRDDAISARRESGIEEVWVAAEEAYLCIDDVNRSEFKGARWSKPTTSGGPLTAERTQPSNKSTVFVPLTPRYVDMAFAKVSEIILPIDDKPFSIDNSPIPDLDAQMKDESPAFDSAGNPLMRDGTPVSRATLLQQAMDEAHARAKREETWIYDRFVESRYPKEMRKVLFDAARLGAGVLKGPVPMERKTQSLTVKGDVAKLDVQIKIQPGVCWFDVWNLFPARGCGEDIHEGDHLFERDYFSPRKLGSLKHLKDQLGRPLYIADAIDKVLAEGPGKVHIAAAQGGQTTDQQVKSNQFEAWNYYGVINAEDFRNMGMPAADDLPSDAVDVYAIVTVVNDTVIRATVNSLESGKFPFRVLCWQRRSGFWAGIGVGERVKVAQAIVNGGTRAMLNNAGKSAGSQIVLDRRAISPADGSWDLNTGDKIWHLTGDKLVDDVKQIFLTYSIPNLTPQMLTIINYALQLAEQSTNLPLIAQGQAGKDDPETFGQSELQNNNANVLLRSIAYAVDDAVTEPLVTDYHEWYLLDPEVPAEDKGDHEINAHGSIAMVERAIQEQVLAQMLGLTVNPVWGQNPKKMFEQYMRTKRLNPKDTAYTEAELKSLPPPPPAPQVQAAQINAATKLHAVEMEGNQRLQEIAAEAQHVQGALTTGGTTPQQATALARVRVEEIKAESAERREMSRSHAEAARADRELQIAQVSTYEHLEELRLKRELAMLDYASKHALTIEQVKGQLANTALRGQIDRQLQEADHAHQANQSESDRAHANAEREALAVTQDQTAKDAAVSGVSANPLDGRAE